MSSWLAWLNGTTSGKTSAASCSQAAGSPSSVRLGGEGLQDRWRPIKLMDVLHEIHPVFGEQIGDLGETALHAMEVAVDASQQPQSLLEEEEDALLRRYVTLLAESHDRAPDPAEVDDMVAAVERPTGWTETVDGRRSVLKEVTHRVDSTLGVTTTHRESLSPANGGCVGREASAISGTGGSQEPVPPPTRVNAAVRFLDAEIIAIYW